MYIYDRQLSDFQSRRKKHPITLWSSEHDSLPSVTRVGGGFGGQQLGQVPIASAGRELSRGFSRSVPLFPAKPAGAAGTSFPLPVLLFPPKPADPLTADPKMERALKN